MIRRAIALCLIGTCAGLFEASSTLVRSIRSSEELQEFERSARPKILMLYAHWCPHCHRFAPTFEESAAVFHQDALFAAVDCADHKPLCEALPLDGYPSLYSWGPNSFMLQSNHNLMPGPFTSNSMQAKEWILKSVAHGCPELEADLRRRSSGLERGGRLPPPKAPEEYIKTATAKLEAQINRRWTPETISLTTVPPPFSDEAAAAGAAPPAAHQYPATRRARQRDAVSAVAFIAETLAPELSGHPPAARPGQAPSAAAANLERRRADWAYVLGVLARALPSGGVRDALEGYLSASLSARGPGALPFGPGSGATPADLAEQKRIVEGGLALVLKFALDPQDLHGAGGASGAPPPAGGEVAGRARALESALEHCKGRGLPCALWQLFHLLTAGANRPLAVDGAGEELRPSPLEIHQAIRIVVREYFQCLSCAQHFAKMFEAESLPRQTGLWEYGPADPGAGPGSPGQLRASGRRLSEALADETRTVETVLTASQAHAAEVAAFWRAVASKYGEETAEAQRRAERAYLVSWLWRAHNAVTSRVAAHKLFAAVSAPVNALAYPKLKALHRPELPGGAARPAEASDYIFASDPIVSAAAGWDPRWPTREECKKCKPRAGFLSAAPAPYAWDAIMQRFYLEGADRDGGVSEGVMGSAEGFDVPATVAFVEESFWSDAMEV